MEQVLNFIFSIFDDIFNLFTYFEFFGITLLDYLFGLMAIGVLLPIVITLTKSTLKRSSSKRSTSSSSESEEE